MANETDGRNRLSAWPTIHRRLRLSGYVELLAGAERISAGDPDCDLLIFAGEQIDQKRKLLSYIFAEYHNAKNAVKMGVNWNQKAEYAWTPDCGNMLRCHPSSTPYPHRNVMHHMVLLKVCKYFVPCAVTVGAFRPLVYPEVCR
jgi:hypothetical protein